MLRATAVVVDSEDAVIQCRAFLGMMWISGTGGVAAYKGQSVVSANHIGSCASGLHLSPSFPIEVDIVTAAGRTESAIVVAAAANSAVVIAYVSK